MTNKLTAEQIEKNWNDLIDIIHNEFSSPRKEKLLELYNNYSDRIIMMPASYKKEYHNAFPGGYVDHILRVIRCSLKIASIWEEEGANMTSFTREELIFSALNHDLGKIGDEENESYIPQTDQWRKEKLGEDYTFNNKIPFASVPDRSLFILQSNGVPYTFNEMVAIQTHDGLYDEGNKKYLSPYLPEQKPRTCLPYILHQADLMASRIEFEKEWLPKFKEDKPSVKSVDKSKEKSPSIKVKALSNITPTPGLEGVINNFFKSDK